MANITHPSLAGPHQVEQFRARSGGAGLTEAQRFGIDRYAHSYGGAPLYLLRGQPVVQDMVLARKLRDDGLGNLSEDAGQPWVIFQAGMAGLVGATIARTAAREQSAPGAPMKTPYGETIYINGATVPQPAPGDPGGRDPYTGQLTGAPQP